MRKLAIPSAPASACEAALHFLRACPGSETKLAARRPESFRQLLFCVVCGLQALLYWQLLSSRPRTACRTLRQIVLSLAGCVKLSHENFGPIGLLTSSAIALSVCSRKFQKGQCNLHQSIQRSGFRAVRSTSGHKPQLLSSCLTASAI